MDDLYCVVQMLVTFLAPLQMVRPVRYEMSVVAVVVRLRRTMAELRV